MSGVGDVWVGSAWGGNCSEWKVFEWKSPAGDCPAVKFSGGSCLG